MSPNPKSKIQNPKSRCFLTVVGATAFCIYSYSWFDAIHLAYDIPAGLATFAFIAQLVVEGYEGRFGGFLLYRSALVIAMTIATVGRQYLGWSISGHLSCVLAIALVQTADARLGRLERLLYWLPVLSVLFLRLCYLETSPHIATYYGVGFGVVWGLPALASSFAPQKG